jgi:zinc protease
MIGFYRLPLDYLDKFISRIEAIKLEDIRKAFRDRINSERMITVTVGGEAKVSDKE